ncbi:MAG: polyhydroxyalkanoic acid synthase [Proteobacteria bacterium]|nr:polyhydroxyalkanoic acid synthase [Pseudomonadota bacterium]
MSETTSGAGGTAGEFIDRSLHAALARMTLGLSPAAVGAAYLDWAVHLTASPGKRLDLAIEAAKQAVRFSNYAWSASVQPSAPHVVEPQPQDHRFVAEGWQQWPFNLVSQGFLLQEQWWQSATSHIRGVSRHHEAMAQFGARQLLDMLSPSNFLFTNPELVEQTVAQGGANLLHGLQHMAEDWWRRIAHQKPVGADAYKVGVNLATSPGKVVLRNQLIELIQYAPTTEKVRPEPILIVPAWIMKYYILDLSESDSLVKYLTDQGFTVFMISWKNPGAAERNFGMEDYRKLGVMAAFDAVSAIVPGPKIHTIGYCLGGTLLSIAAASMARDGDRRLKTVTLLAAQTDFTEAGELTLFIDESQVAFLEDMMWEQGGLDASQMSGAFRMLRSNDLLWSYIQRNYLLGERRPLNDLMAWNADATRMPYRMHSEYLRHLFLDNDLAEGSYLTDGKPVAVSDIRVPIFAVGTEWDHVAPWRSTYKIHLLADSAITYVLTVGGHNAGIVSSLDRPHRSYRIGYREAGGAYVDPDRWLAAATRHEGSWWPALAAWLGDHSGEPAPPPSLGATEGGYPPLGDAPGTYVLES